MLKSTQQQKTEHKLQQLERQLSNISQYGGEDSKKAVELCKIIANEISQITSINNNTLYLTINKTEMFSFTGIAIQITKDSKHISSGIKIHPSEDSMVNEVAHLLESNAEKLKNKIWRVEQNGDELLVNGKTHLFETDKPSDSIIDSILKRFT